MIQLKHLTTEKDFNKSLKLNIFQRLLFPSVHKKIEHIEMLLSQIELDIDKLTLEREFLNRYASQILEDRTFSVAPELRKQPNEFH